MRATALPIDAIELRSNPDGEYAGEPGGHEQPDGARPPATR